MAKRFCVLFPDGSLNIHSNQRGEVAAKNEARAEARSYNKGETNATEKASFGEIDVDLLSFKELT